MGYDSITELVKAKGGIQSFIEYYQKRLDNMKVRMHTMEYADKVIINRDGYIDGFQIRDFDSFIEGAFYAEAEQCSCKTK